MNSKTYSRFIASIALIFCLGMSIGVAEDGGKDGQVEHWHNFRGPNYDGTSPTAKPPTKWSETENVAWKVRIPGKGSSSPVIWDNMVFLTSAVNTSSGNTKPPRRMDRREMTRKFDENGNGKLDPDERTKAMAARRAATKEALAVHKFMVMCIDRANGKTIWSHAAAEKKPNDGHHADGGYASASPVVDGEHVYFNFGSVGLFCYDLDGKKIWERTDLGEMQMRGSFGEGSSVAINGDVLILPWDHEGQSRIEAINKKTGETLWKKDRDEPSNWATPRIVSVDGNKQVIHAGEKFSRGYDLETGDEIWRSSGLSSRPVSTPVSKGNVGIFASARGGFAMNAYHLNKRGDISSEPAWKIDRQTPDCPSLLLSDNRLFFVSGNKGIVSCANANDGSTFFTKKRVPGISEIYSSPVAADGKVFVTGRRGKTVVLEDSEQFQVVSENSVDENVDATLALAGKQLFIRGNEHLYCIQEK